MNLKKSRLHPQGKNPKGGTLMVDPVRLEAAFKQYISNLNEWAPDGILNIDLRFLAQERLLQALDNENWSKESVTHYFRIIETADKITLFNDKFVIWIVPELINNQPITYALIGSISEQEMPDLEMVFSTDGVFNSSAIILRILEFILKDIEENEATIRSLQA